MIPSGPSAEPSSGSGYDEGDPVAILGDVTEPVLDQLQPEPGRWLVPKNPGWRAPATGQPMTVGIVDTGVRPDHPSLRGRVVAQVDLTGEGPTDLHGHGTKVAAVLAAHTSDDLRIVSVKCLRRDGHADVGMLAAGILQGGAAVARLGGSTLNVSAGRRTPSCVGDCPLCSAVLHVAQRHHIVVAAAAGNEPGITYCPARVAISVTVAAPGHAHGDFSFPLPDWEVVDG